MVFFLNPWFLVGAVTAAIPLVLHLALRRRAMLMEFPALRFVRRGYARVQRRLRLREIMLLLLRVAALILLAFYFARPVVVAERSWFYDSGPVAAALVIDSSPRMDYRYQNTTLLDRARKEAAEVMRFLPGDSQIAVLDCRPESLGFQPDRAAARYRLERISPLPGGLPLAAAVDRAVQLLDTSQLDTKELYVFSDLARVAWPEATLRALARQMASRSGLTMILVDVGVDEPRDFGLGDLQLSSEMAPIGSLAHVKLPVFGVNQTGAPTVDFYLSELVWSGDAESDPAVAAQRAVFQRRESRTVSISADGLTTVSFAFPVNKPGIYQGYLEIRGEDPLRWNNRRFFTVHATAPWRILLVCADPAAENGLFLHRMLAPEAWTQTGRAIFECRLIDAKDYRSIQLNEFSAIALVDPPALLESFWDQLLDFVKKGGGLAIFLGRNSGWAVEPTRSAQALLLAKPLRQARVPEGTFFSPPGFQHPVLSGLAPYRGSLPWDVAPVFRYWQLNDIQEKAQVVLPFADGQPAVLEYPIGEGRVLLFTTPISDPPTPTAWNFLTAGESWAVVALVHQAFSYLCGGMRYGWNYWTGQPIAMPIRDESPIHDLRTSRWQVQPAHAEQPGTLTADWDGEAKLLKVSAEGAWGNYRLIEASAPSGRILGFSLNLPAEHTDLTRIKPDELIRLLGTDRVRLERTLKDRHHLGSGRSHQRELLPWLALVLLGCLLLEYWLANRFYEAGKASSKLRDLSRLLPTRTADSERHLTHFSADNTPSKPLSVSNSRRG